MSGLFRQSADRVARASVSRREFISSLSAVAIAGLGGSQARAAQKSFGIAYTSFAVRLRQAAQNAAGGAGNTAALSAEKMIELCHAFGGDGCQLDLARLSSFDAAYLKRIRALAEEKGMFLELSVGARTLGDPEALESAAAAARQLGVARLRAAMLSGRRYEDFSEMGKWREFVARSEQILQKAEPVLRRNKLMVGVENHKDWLTDELVEMLRRADSPHLGACVDFGNNLALLEDAVELAQKLAPYAVTTHLKDMAVRPYADGFELSEVPLGEGILPLGRIIEILRRERSDIHFCLEMITRDPLKVPYRADRYWATYEKRDTTRAQKFEAFILRLSSPRPLPTISDLDSAGMLEAEDENIRRSVAYAKKSLKL